MTDFDFRKHIDTRLKEVRTSYLQDLEAMSHEALGSTSDGKTRSAYDFTYEIISLNNRLAKRLNGEDPGPWPFESWAVAPAEYQDKARCVADFQSSMDEMQQNLGEDLFRTVSTPTGETTPFDLANFCAVHINYHDGQLNYIQELQGDMAMHWTDD